MFKKQTSLKISVIVLAALAVMDLIRGYMHTFNVLYASENIAHMTQTPDTLNLMNSFGISNFLTGFIFIIIVLKAKEIAPYVLLAIPAAYLLGIISLNVTGIAAMQESAWNGKYMMYVYLIVSFLVSVNYFLSSFREKNKLQKETH